MNIEAIKLTLLRLSLAQLAFEQTRDLVLHAQVVFDSPHDPLAAAIFAGIISSYTRPFKRNDGIGRLPQNFSQFENDSDLKGLHEMLILARDVVYSHRDTTKTNALGSDLIDSTEFLEIELEIKNNDFSIHCSEPILHLSILPHINRLCDYQGEKTHQETEKIVNKLKKEMGLSPGKYRISNRIEPNT